MEEEASNSESSNYPRAWESSLKPPELCRAATAADQRRLFLLSQFLWLLGYSRPGARSRFSGDSPLNLGSTAKATGLASGGFLLHKYETQRKLHSSDSLVFWNVRKTKYLFPPPTFFPDGWLGSHSAFQYVQSHICCICCVEIGNKKPVCYYSHTPMT